MGVGSELPVLPVSLLRASSLGGGMVQFFLGNIAVMPNQGVDAVVQLHPFAIAGVIGCITNALTLLPLGRKYRCVLVSFVLHGAHRIILLPHRH